jgi:hypothetical protein
LFGKKCTDDTPGVMFETKQLVIGTVETISISLPSVNALPVTGNVINKLATVPCGDALQINLL